MKILDGLRDRLRKATLLLKATPPAARVDVDAINDTIQRALASAGLDTRSGPMKGVTDTIQQALSAAGLNQHASNPGQRDTVIEGVVSRVTAANTATPQQGTPRARAEPTSHTKPALPGEFVSRSFTNHAGTRIYKVYVPANYSSALEPVPMVVMLHGCTQDPDDFAAGTGMNDAAREAGCLVLYPAQSRQANPQGCWNWFKRTHQARGRGEAGLLAAMTQKIAAQHEADPSRIYVAGLSAGGAMAAILGETYPDLFAAVGVHSGLAAGSARDLQSALSAMKSGAPAATKSAKAPTIVFHGDADGTVHPSNGAHVVASTTAAGDTPDVERQRAPAGRDYTRSVHRAPDGGVLAEHWVVHGSAHAWSGGRSAGSYTDPRGPDATAEMLRFFLEHPRSGG